MMPFYAINNFMGPSFLTIKNNNRHILHISWKFDAVIYVISYSKLILSLAFSDA
jgi:hypothetical protein